MQWQAVLLPREVPSVLLSVIQSTVLDAFPEFIMAPFIYPGFVVVRAAALRTELRENLPRYLHKPDKKGCYRAMSMFKRSIAPRWALMAAHGWARPILDRRRGLIQNDGPNRAAAAEAPLDAAHERHHFNSPRNHTIDVYNHSEAA